MKPPLDTVCEPSLEVTEQIDSAPYDYEGSRPRRQENHMSLMRGDVDELRREELEIEIVNRGHLRYAEVHALREMAS